MKRRQEKAFSRQEDAETQALKPTSEPIRSTLPPPSKKLGQNFLSDKRVVDRIVNALDPHPDETIVEIGPGRGALTRPILDIGSRLIAVEFDRSLIPVLEEQFGSKDNFKLVQSDALDTEFCEVIRPAPDARVIANLPYNVGTAILQRLIQQRSCLNEMVLMLQKEVVDRVIAAPGTAERGFLSVLVEAYCETEKLFDVGPGAFRPAPKVWSSVVRLRPLAEKSALIKNEKLMWQVVSAGFAQRRKTILNNLRSAPSPLQEMIKSYGGASIVLCQAGVGLQKRAETLTLEEWTRIVRVME